MSALEVDQRIDGRSLVKKGSHPAAPELDTGALNDQLEASELSPKERAEEVKRVQRIFDYFPPTAGIKLVRETLGLLSSRTFRGEGVPHGHGETVVVVPGLSATKEMYKPLEAALYNADYSPINVGTHTGLDTYFSREERIMAIASQNGEQHFVPHSKGLPDTLKQAQKHPELFEGKKIVGVGGAVNMPGIGISGPLPEGLDVVNITSTADVVVTKKHSSYPNVRNRELSGITHIGLPVSEPGVRAILQALAEERAELKPQKEEIPVFDAKAHARERIVVPFHSSSTNTAKKV